MAAARRKRTILGGLAIGALATTMLAGCGGDDTVTDQESAPVNPTTAPTGSPVDVDPSETTASSLSLTSPDFDDGAALPDSASTTAFGGQCDGPNTSPALSWSGASQDVASYALAIVDVDASDFVHAIVIDVPADASGVDAGAWDELGIDGATDAGTTGYFGPCPPSGTHSYVFTVYALDSMLGLSEGFAYNEAVDAMVGHVLGEASLTGTFSG
ncbi:YbhB/YbcL family Raf kinase inhibitor-like protein [Demequina sp. NBRC 110054]|uniref:YbhB/YbcL family Raf kinase inhibitor-like protein n=1 Tax=Demequina sp. NBRC 110054 TaxID=1570343 RepID=UPI0013565AE4|nr:YbhB/YbcL family Raf kinase inhibitor-like protein [Demequina sp. NBRC 110054]